MNFNKIKFSCVYQLTVAIDNSDNEMKIGYKYYLLLSTEVSYFLLACFACFFFCCSFTKSCPTLCNPMD